MTKEIEILENVRNICKSLPEAKETIDGFGHIVFRVNGKPFARIGGTEEQATLSFKSDKENQEILIQDSRYFKTPYIGQHGWVSIKSPTDWPVLGELIQEAFLRTAPKRLAEQIRSRLST